jgi:hypothetical protein
MNNLDASTSQALLGFAERAQAAPWWPFLKYVVAN